MTEQNSEPQVVEINAEAELKDFHEGKRISTSEAEAAGLVKITDPAAIANIFIAWHMDLCNQGQHVLNADLNNPDDPQQIAIMVHDPEHKDARPEDGFRMLTMEEVVPFKHGVRYMLDMLAELPVSYTPTDADGKVLPAFASESELAQQEQDQE